MENIYSPPIGALFEPIAIAAQNGLAALRVSERGASTTSSAACATAPSTTCCRPRRASSARACPAPWRRTASAAGVLWRWLFVPLYRRVPWHVKQRAMTTLQMTARGWTPPPRTSGEPWRPPPRRQE